MLTGTRVPGPEFTTRTRVVKYPNLPDPWFGLDPVGSGSVPNRLQIGRRIAAALYECAAAHMAH